MSGDTIVAVLAAHYELIEWSMAALLGLAAALAALKLAKIGPLWAVVIGMLVFTGLQMPLQTHAVMLDMPRKSN